MAFAVSLPQHKHGGRSSAGRAPGCGPGCRGFEPRRSPHLFGKELPTTSRSIK